METNQNKDVEEIATNSKAYKSITAELKKSEGKSIMTIKYETQDPKDHGITEFMNSAPIQRMVEEFVLNDNETLNTKMSNQAAEEFMDVDETGAQTERRNLSSDSVSQTLNVVNFSGNIQRVDINDH